MAIDRLPCVVIGAGVIGLSVARAVAASLDTIVLEARSRVGEGNSSRNSEGRSQLYKYLESRKLPHRKLGKLIVSSSSIDNQRLDALLQLSQRNGVSDIVPVTKADIRHLEPLVEASRGLLSPSTGILNSHALLLSLQHDLETLHCPIVFNCRVDVVQVISNGFLLHTSDGSVECSHVINCAGLSANALATHTAGHAARRVPSLHFLKGSYMKYSGPAPFQRLVYPLPRDGGLGVHATIDMSGAVRFGPDAQWITSKNCNNSCLIDESLDMNPSCDVSAFSSAIASYFPTLDPLKLSPDYAGVRPKLWGSKDEATAIDEFGRSVSDFIIEGPAQHGVQGLVNLYGIESPGLTAAFAIADHVAKLIK